MVSKKVTMKFIKLRSCFALLLLEETYSLYGRDVFVHRMQIQVGQHVYFDVELNNKGHPQARNIVAVNPHVRHLRWADANDGDGEFLAVAGLSYGNYGGCGFNGGYTYDGGGGSSGGGNNNRLLVAGLIAKLLQEAVQHAQSGALSCRSSFELQVPPLPFPPTGSSKEAGKS
ncbi:hypothetical protein AK812_SmicGene37621 [Symbiodinium microadriaticum]|uniref:Uncharacterized protein n=1 Tax=Symbiodinium microadriaticum TaxID=2951 RepID=A0A1Q9CFY7_SYMMI|nr:hypothetical protein AK812_SmicGene37621 [Symbiodinium microadriaticum]